MGVRPLLLLASFCKTGFWFIPNVGLSQKIALDPFVNPSAEPYAQYLVWNWLSPFLAWLVGATDSGPFVLFRLAFAVAFTGQFALRASGSDDRHAPDRSFIPTR